MMTREEIKRDVLLECTDDFVGLWSILWRINRWLEITDRDKARQVTMELIGELMRDGLIRAGIPTGKARGEFKVWNLSPAETVKRINEEWNSLNEEPGLGDIVWFTSTQKGDQLVQKWKTMDD